MTAQQQSRAPDTERAFKEVLYRFMGDVHATKAALYLKSTDGNWSLATQYGFGRRDRLSESFADDHPIVRMVRAFGEDPRFYNDPSETGELESYLTAAGTARLMLVPLVGSAGQVGFVDVRDKGGQRPFVVEDLDLSRSIAVRLAELVEEAEDGEDNGPAGRTEAAKTAVPPPALEPPVDPGDGPRALLDEPGFDEINGAAVDVLADPRVVAIALSIASRTAGATLVHQRSGSPAVELDPLITHQAEAMRQASVPVPPSATWKTEVHRVAATAGAARNPVIGTSILLAASGSCLVASVIADAEPALAKQTLERLGCRVAEARERFRLRIARRGLARRLLQPGDRRYPELVAHSLGVSRLCWSIARVLGFDESATEEAALAGLLHDVGMRELDYDRLYMHPTPGPEDRRTYRMHVEVGDRIVRVEGFDEIADAVRHHHERWDGNGYPDRLANTAIPALARIVHVAEVFDLFTAANSYRPAVSQERALAILQRAAGHQFDPAVVEAIAKVIA
jgi:putative nucleotidyltransferase with HDIG domain